MTTTADNPIALLAQADLILLLCDFLRSPSAGPKQSVAVEAHELAGLIDAAQLQDHKEFVDAVTAAASEIAKLEKSNWSDEYHRLCEGAMVVPLNETAYVRRDKGAILGDLAGFYNAFGWRATNADGEKPDHLLSELEYLSMLFVMRARAFQEDNHEAHQITSRAMSLFATAHLGDWLPAVCERLRHFTVLPSLATTAAALELLWKAIVQRYEFPITPSGVEPAPAQEPEDPYDCAGPGVGPNERHKIIDLNIPTKE